MILRFFSTIACIKLTSLTFSRECVLGMYTTHTWCPMVPQRIAWSRIWLVQDLSPCAHTSTLSPRTQLTHCLFALRGQLEKRIYRSEGHSVRMTCWWKYDSSWSHVYWYWQFLIIKITLWLTHTIFYLHNNISSGCMFRTAAITLSQN